MSKLKRYTLYGESVSGRFTTKSAYNSTGTHPWIVVVNAENIREAFRYAYSAGYAVGEDWPGVILKVWPWWRYGCKTCETLGTSCDSHVRATPDLAMRLREKLVDVSAYF